MAKDKARNAAKKRQERALKANRRAKANKGKVRQRAPVTGIAKIPEGEFPDEDRLFWMAHGINYLHSDWNEAVWNPLFPEAYESPEKLDIDLISGRIVKFSEIEVEDMSGAQRAILGYAFQEQLAHYAFMKEAERRLTAKGVEDPREEARKPHQSTVWQMFHDEILVKALKRADK